MSPTQHRYNVLASNLLYLAFFTSVLFNFFIKQGFFTPHLPARTLGALLGLTVLAFALYYCIRRGYGWAKVLFVVMYSSTLLLNTWPDLQRLVTTSATASLETINFLQQTALQIAAMVLIVLSFAKRGL